MEKYNFHIDQALGVATYLEVVEGIVISFKDDKTKLFIALSNQYTTQSISYLQEHFEKLMKPSYSKVKYNDLAKNQRRADVILAKIKNLNESIISEKDKKVAKTIMNKRNMYIGRLSKIEMEIAEIKEYLLIMHEFVQ